VSFLLGLLRVVVIVGGFAVDCSDLEKR
jgi:hypothetical protein